MASSAYQLATSMLGSNEHANHGILTQYLKNGGVNLDPAQQAWCAAFVNASLQQAGQQGTNSNLARSFLRWGVDTKTPKEGDIAVFSRGDPNGPYGHVGFYKGTDAQGNIRILGGNQSDSVSERTMPASRLLGFRTQDPNALFPDAPTTSTIGPPGGGGVGYVGPGGAPSATPPATPGVSLASAPVPAAGDGGTPAQATPPSFLDRLTGNKDAMSGLDDMAKALKPKADPEANKLLPGPSADMRAGQTQGLAQNLMSDIMQNVNANIQGTNIKHPNINMGLTLPTSYGSIGLRGGFQPGSNDYTANLLLRRQF